MKLKGTGVEGVARSNVSSYTKDRSGAEGDEESNEWGELGLQASCAQSCRLALAHPSSKTQILTFLAREHLDHSEGINVLGGDIRHSPGCLRLPFGRSLDVSCIVKDNYCECRDDGEGENGKWDTVERHNSSDTPERQNADQQVDQAICDEFLNVGYIAGDALNEVSLLLLAMPVKRGTLQMFKELLAQLRAEMWRTIVS